MTKPVLALLAVALAALIYAGVNGRHADQWHQRATDALATSAAQRDTIAAIRQQATRSAQEAQTASDRADSAVRVIRGLTEALGRLHGHSSVLVAAAPDTCQPVIQALQAERDTALALADSTRSALADAGNAVDGYRLAYRESQHGLDLAQSRGDSLAAVLKAAPKSCKYLGLIPCLTVTAGVIIGPTGGVQPGVAVGVPIRF